MSVAKWGLALSFCPWDLNTVRPAITSLACALLAVCHRTVSFPFYSSYLRHKFSAILRPDHDKSHMHSQAKTKIEVLLAVKNVPAYPNRGVFLSLVCQSVSFTGLLLRELHNVKLIRVVHWEKGRDLGGIHCHPLQIWAVLPSGCSPEGHRPPSDPVCSACVLICPGHPAVSNKMWDVPVSRPDPSQDPCSFSSGTWHWTFQSFFPQSSDTE